LLYKFAAHELGEDDVLIWGPLAELATIALTGLQEIIERDGSHSSSPRLATIQNAAAARALLNMLAEEGDQAGGLDLVVQAAHLWGHKVKPWWCRMTTDENGRLLWEAPEYSLEWEISPVTVGSVSHADAMALAMRLDVPPDIHELPAPLTRKSMEPQHHLGQIEYDREQWARRAVEHTQPEPGTPLYLEYLAKWNLAQVLRDAVVETLERIRVVGSISDEDIVLRGTESSINAVQMLWKAPNPTPDERRRPRAFDSSLIEFTILMNVGLQPDLCIYEMDHEIMITLDLDPDGMRVRR
jgi:hypothetical protein